MLHGNGALMAKILHRMQPIPCNLVSPVDDGLYEPYNFRTQDLYNMIEVLQEKREVMSTKITRIIAAVGLSKMYVL